MLSAQAAVKIAEGYLEKAKSSAAAAEMEVELRQLYLSRSRILAPVSGTVKQVNALPGEFVPRRKIVVVNERDD